MSHQSYLVEPPIELDEDESVAKLIFKHPSMFDHIMRTAFEIMYDSFTKASDNCAGLFYSHLVGGIVAQILKQPELWAFPESATKCLDNNFSQSVRAYFSYHQI